MSLVSNGKKEFVFIFTYHLLPLATGKDYPSISKTGQQNPVIALEDFISAYFEFSDFPCQNLSEYNFSVLQLL